MNNLRKDYNLCKSELTKMKNDQSSKRVTRSMAKKINEESEVEDPRKALFAAIKARAPKEDSPPADPRQALFAAIKSRKQDVPQDNEVTDSNTDYSPGVKRLQGFLNHSKAVLSLADSDQDTAIRACKVKMLPAGCKSNYSYILLISSFCNLNRALPSTVEREEASEPQLHFCK